MHISLFVHVHTYTFAMHSLARAGRGAAYSINLISRNFARNDDEVYYVPCFRAPAEFRNLYARMCRDIFVLMRLLFGNETFVKPDA